MNTKRQLGIAVLFVVAAAAAVFFLTRSDRAADEQQEAAMEGHDHAAMLAGLDEAQAVTLPPDLLDRTGITFARAMERPLVRRVNALGRVEYDETRLVDFSPRLEGWAEKLHVNFTGAPVRAGEPLLDFYSPALVAAQEELILAYRLASEATPGTERALQADRLLQSARRRLAYWDIPEETIHFVEETGQVERAVTLMAPASGIVVGKNVVEGARVTPGQPLYRIADLSRVWIEADIFERDLSLVTLGREAAITLEAYPGEVLRARVTYVYPELDVETRTGTVRLELDNPALRIKPGMYASLEFNVPTSGPVLLVPRGAVLATGERTLVFVQEPDATLVPREVVTGLTAGQEIEILSGLRPGEVVVSSASFLIDAESNLGSATMNLGDSSMEEMGEMDHSGHEMPAGPDTMPGGEMDHSGHEMPAGPDTMPGGEMDHSNHSPPTPPDSSGHSGHNQRG